MTRFLLILLTSCCFAGETSAQFTLKGIVLDSSRLYGVKNVMVNCTCGNSTLTDSAGRYSLNVNEQDSVWFYYNNKPTIKYPLHIVRDINNFDIALNIKVEAKYKRLKEVTVFSRSYRRDSLENRKEYADVFGYEKPGLKSSMVNGVAGADLDALINMFRFRKKKYDRSFQKRLVNEEQEKFVDHKFNKKIVEQLTGLKDKDRDTFMLIFRPTYAFAASTSLYDFYWYIKMSSQQYKLGTRQNLFFRKLEEFNREAEKNGSP